jgi:YVTN family beta-propeller protein
VPRRLAAFVFALVASAAFAGSSNSLMDVHPDGTRLAVANTDAGTITVVDLKARKKLAEFPCGDHPEGVSWAGKSDTLLATVWGDDRVMFYDATKGHQFTLKVDDEPYGVVTTADGKFAYVTHDYPGTISEIDVAARKVVRTFPVGKFTRGLAISKDDKTLYASEFFTATLVAVDRASGKVTDTWPGYDFDNLARHVTLHPTRPKAYVTHLRSRTTAFDAAGSIFPQVSMCDLFERPKDEKRRRSIALDTYNGVYVPTNPWESAVSPDGKRAYTIYAGTNDLNVHDVIDDDYRELKRKGNAVRIGQHPRAIRTSPDGAEVYIYNTLDFEVTVYDANVKKLDAVKVCEPPHSADWRRGKELFVTALTPMGGGRGIGWVSCSSCHPDGVTDGRTWQNPEGNRKTPNLFGLAHTFPLHWSADRDESQDFEYTIRGVLMRGRGLSGERLKQGKEFDPVALEQKTSGLSKDLDAMAVYTNSFPVRLSPHAAGPGKLTEQAERGKKVFETAKCATCHTGAYYSDSSLGVKPFKTHDVGTGGDKREKMGSKFDTPTLLGVYRLPTFLHDGRAKTLEEVFTTHNKDDKHGTTSQLKPAEVADLVAFVKSLPYETPPEDTPNTVPHFLKGMRYPRPEEKK